MIAILTMGVGVLIGWLSRLTITINHNHTETPREMQEVIYNESMVDELDSEIKSYYDHSNGLNKF